MRTINLTFEDEEYKLLLEKKERLSWHDFILKLLKEDRIKREDEN
jgi:predicted CopG family antitoxin